VPTKTFVIRGTIIDGIEVISLGTFVLLSTHTLLNFSKKGDLYKDWMNSLQFAQ
jgi:hypothetical protein